MTLRTRVARWLLRGSGYLLVREAEVRAVDALCTKLQAMARDSVVFQEDRNSMMNLTGQLTQHTKRLEAE